MSLSYFQRNDSLNINQPMASIEFSMMITKHIEQYYRPPYKELIFLCIGTDRSTGDALGPLIGDKLTHYLSQYQNTYLYGTLDEPVHAKNLEENIKKIYTTFNHPFIVAIDACLGKLERVGYITVGHGPLKPGAGVNKSLPAVGDIHITGIVNMGGYMEYLILQNTRLNLVMKMANTITQAVKYSLWKIHQQNLSIEH